ncbi:alpha/beta fold hydrolase [Promicromonospora thailandica]|uniref:Pimeloyl-ACP methyl ester carboxylesterase n=1 Tax=Promicromonospora thailandica TaxID=765201 RepID=A0A9X2G040_9MICO|nr:alpha/beta hydrolase [Promicromonospora thailandica]MCP2263228.1 Pimeloyl-ACP methyl ester carboxylesterase [Promicromonospora thailandica]BFF18616.1 alpha/beta hydrolase [Promicromonospora thailandica]
MTVTIPDLDQQRVAVGDVTLNVAVGGTGSPVVLLHGFPQTHLMWRHVAADLVRDHTVIAPDLRGYGASDKPDGSGPDTYSKRTMATDVVALAHTLGFDRFALAGHDRGALVAVRAGLDHPRTVTHLAVLDVLPTLDMWDVLHGADAAVAFHLYLMAQPPGLPERMIEASADEFFGFFLDAWGTGPEAIPAAVRAEYLRAARAAVPSIVADYRASAGIDLEHDRADRAAGHRLTMPVTVLQQDWGAALGYDAAGLWSAWAADLEHRTLDAGHFMAEQSPREVVAALRALLAR